MNKQSTPKASMRGDSISAYLSCTHPPDPAVGEHAVADGSHGVLPHPEVHVAAVGGLLLEPNGAALRHKQAQHNRETEKKTAEGKGAIGREFFVFLTN
jgi:hypothetical protein